MYDNILVVDTLHRIEETICEIKEWTESLESAEDFLATSSGMILLNAVCMKLLALGEEVKALDRRTQGELLPRYNQIPWKEVMGLRDIIAHHYFEVDAYEIFAIIRNDLVPLLHTLKQIISEIN